MLNLKQVVNMEIRKLKIEDYDELYRLWKSMKGMGLNNLDDSREGIEKFLKRNPNTCFVACVNDQIIGAIMSGHDGRRGFIYHTCVLEKYQGKGYGKQLVEVCMKALEKEGINKAALVVFERNQQGNEFWEHMGFTTREDLVYRNKTIKEMIRYDS